MEEIKYTCCFCNKTVVNKNPVQITISIDKKECSQSFYCHMRCFAEKTQDYAPSYSVVSDKNNNIVFFKKCVHNLTDDE